MLTPDAVVYQHEGLVRKFAGMYETDQWPFDDLAQEGRIAVWKESTKRPGDDLAGLASYVIKRRVVKLVSGEGAPTAFREVGERSWSPRETASIEAMAARQTHGDRSAQLIDRIVGWEPSAEFEVVQSEAQAALDRMAEEGKLATVAAEPKLRKYTHGTETCYRKTKCRCDLCRAEHQRLKVEYNARKAAKAA